MNHHFIITCQSKDETRLSDYERFAGGRDGGVNALASISELKPGELEVLIKTGVKTEACIKSEAVMPISQPLRQSLSQQQH
jgi:hypothetical protein